MVHAIPVSRALFDDVMVPNYAPAAIIPVRGEVRGCGIRRAWSISTLPAGLRSPAWVMPIPGWWRR